MMAQKPLHELLQEDQEPFLLKNYIADRRFQLGKPKKSTNVRTLQIKKPKPISQNSNFSHNFCKNACFFSVNDSPDLMKRSPLFEFQSPVKSPCKSPNAIFLHIPAKTASLLLEAALRIQKQSSSSNQRPKTNNGFGLFGSLIKRLTRKTRNSELSERTKVSVKDILKWDHSRKNGTCKRGQEMGLRRSYNEDKSWDLDLETSSSGQLLYEEEEVAADMVFDDDEFCESPFRFALKRSPSSCSSGHRTPVFLSPVNSPCRYKTEGKGEDEVKKIEENEEEDKEQCSPVSVLDPPFDDDDDGHDDHSEYDGCDLDCSYVFVQRAKQQLLQKLCRFEKLAELDPVELEKRMLEQEQESDDAIDEEEEEEAELDDIDEFIMEELRKSTFCQPKSIPKDMKRLVSDLIKEEEVEHNCETAVKRVCKRLESWKKVESNTIDMMVEEDFKTEFKRWSRYQEQIQEAALDIELGIFRSLVKELSEELN